MSGQRLYPVLADAVLILHALLVVFVVSAVVFIVIGKLRGWQWVYSPWFRIMHMGAIAIVVAESWFDIVCPLTTLEMWLRMEAGQRTHDRGFIEYWMQNLLYYDAPGWVFVLAYSLFGLLAIAIWLWAPPRFRR